MDPHACPCGTGAAYDDCCGPLLANREQVLRQSQFFRQALDELETMMRTDNVTDLEQAITAASQVRGEWRLGSSTESPDA